MVFYVIRKPIFKCDAKIRKKTHIRNFKGTYIPVDTAIQNNKDYLNQQHQQLVSTTCAAINSLPRLGKMIYPWSDRGSSYLPFGRTIGKAVRFGRKLLE